MPLEEESISRELARSQRGAISSPTCTPVLRGASGHRESLGRKGDEGGGNLQWLEQGGYERESGDFLRLLPTGD